MTIIEHSKIVKMFTYILIVFIFIHPFISYFFIKKGLLINELPIVNSQVLSTSFKVILKSVSNLLSFKSIRDGDIEKY